MKPRMASYASAVLLVGILVIGVACTKAVNDNDVTQNVLSKINADSGLQDKQLSVETTGGVVTLAGTVDNEGQRTAAARYASSASGVKQVVNNLQVAPSATSAVSEEPAPTERTQRAAKPRPSTPRQRPSSRPSEMASAQPSPSPAPVQDSHPSPTQSIAPAAAAPAPPPPPKKVTLPSGTSLTIRLVDAIDSETSQPGQSFKATLDSPLSVDGDVVVPAGHDVQGHIVDVKSAGKFAGKSELVLELDRISVGGKSYSIQTDQYRREGSSRGKNTAKKVGAGAAIGAIIGGIAGGGKGAAIGAAAGGGVGGGVQAATKGQQIKLPSETVLNFSLQSSLTVTATSAGPNPARQKLEAPAAEKQAPQEAPQKENLGPQ
jgi:hypothetical protein